MNKKALIISLAGVAILIVVIVAYVLYNANKSDNENNDASENSSVEVLNNETAELNEDEDVANEEADEDVTNDEDNDVTEDTSTNKDDIDVSGSVESRLLNISFVFPSSWYWAGRSDGLLAFSNKENAAEINLGNAPDDYQAFFLGRDDGSIAEMLSDETVTKQTETYDGAKVKLYTIENEEGAGRRMYALWTNSDGVDYYGVTAGPVSDANVDVEMSKMQEVILTIQHVK